MKRKLLLILGMYLLCTTSCQLDKNEKASNPQAPKVPAETEDAVSSDDLTLAPSLRGFETCSAAKNYMADSLRAEIADNFAQQRFWHEKYIKQQNSENAGIPEGIPEAEGAASDSASNETSAGSNTKTSGPKDYTTTNTQESDVDEADIVKNTGTHIFALGERHLRIIKSWPANEMELVASIDFGENIHPSNMVLFEEEQKLVIVSNWHQLTSPPSEKPTKTLETGVPAPQPFYMNSISIKVFDISDITSPKEVEEYILDGSYVSLRRIGPILRILHRPHFFIPYHYLQMHVPTWENGRMLTLEEYDQRAASISAENEAALSNLTLEDWFRIGHNYKKNENGKQNLIPSENCDWIQAPTTKTPLGLSAISTIDLTEGAGSQTLLLSSVSGIYASKQSLYLTTPYWNGGNWRFSGGGIMTDAVAVDESGAFLAMDEASERAVIDFTFVHKFDITTENDSKVRYIGSGMVAGNILNQFSMGEHNDFLRIATTITHRIKNENPQHEWDKFRFETSNRISVMEAEGELLTVVGQTRDLAPGERIFSSRFVGDRGFVVTFRQVDPLYTLDLSDPYDPKVVGELKIPGFSSYIHMMDDHHLLTIGRDATEEGQILGMKVSVFDVSDMANPREALNLIINNDGWNWSQAQWNHHAFTYYPSRNLLAIPLTSYNYNKKTSNWWERYVSELVIVDARPDSLSVRGNITMNDLKLEGDPGYNRWMHHAMVKRSIFADDFVYAISDMGIRSRHIEKLDSPLDTVAYPE